MKRIGISLLTVLFVLSMVVVPAQNVSASQMPGACDSSVSKKLYKTRYFYDANKNKLSGASLKVYRTLRSKGEYCVVAKTPSTTSLSLSLKCKTVRKTATSKWPKSADCVTTVLSNTYKYSTFVKSSSKKVGYQIIVAAGSYSAKTPMLTKR